MTTKEIKVPNIGEFTNVEVIEVLIKKDQVIKKNDPLITIESDKSSVEIPSTLDGKVLSLNIKVGDKVSEGDKILELQTIDNLDIKKDNFKSKKETDKPVIVENTSSENNNKKSNLIVTNFRSKTSASPKVRKFARELGIDINQVPGSERDGRVVESDIKYFVSTRSNESFKSKVGRYRRTQIRQNK